MAYFFTLLYLVTAYLTPTIVFGPLADYHVEIIVVILAIVTSIPQLSGSGLFRAPQIIALCGLAFAILASIVQTGWLGGAIGPLYGFMQHAFAFLLVAVNFKRRKHFILLVLALIACSTFFIIMGLHDLHNAVSPSDYLYGEGSLRRVRGLGFVHDPNDFAQVLVLLVPCVFLWRKNNLILDFFILGVPLSILVTGMYFTHSRGAMLALTAVVLFAARRKIGIVPALALAGCLGAGTFALGWSGGRDVSMDAGADRLDLWYAGMQSLKAHPLFGIGLNSFVGEFGLTAHNSVIICAAELGVVGLFFWIMLITSSVIAAVQVQKTEALQEVKQDGPLANSSKEVELFGSDPCCVQQPNDDLTGFNPSSASNVDSDQYHSSEASSITWLLLIALAGMLTSGWFISRALSMWLFMVCGMIYAASRMDNRQDVDTNRFALAPVIKWSALSTVGAIGLLYLILRTRNLVSH